jgi:hypothetical protein
LVKGSVSYFQLKDKIKLDINCSEYERLVSRVKSHTIIPNGRVCEQTEGPLEEDE